MHAHTHAHTHRSTCLVRLSVCPPSEARLPPWCQWEGRVRQSELRVRSCVSNPSLEWLTYSVTVCSLSKHLPSVLWSAVACLRERERERKWRRGEVRMSGILCRCVQWSGPRTTLYTWAGRVAAHTAVMWSVIGSVCSQTAGSSSGQAEDTHRTWFLQIGVVHFTYKFNRDLSHEPIMWALQDYEIMVSGYMLPDIPMQGRWMKGKANLFI